MALLEERVEEGDRLYGLAEAHLVGEYDVGALRPREAQPIESLELIGVQLAATRRAQVVRLLVVALGRLLFGHHPRLLVLGRQHALPVTHVAHTVLVPVVDLRRHTAALDLPRALVVVQVAPLDQVAFGEVGVAAQAFVSHNAVYLQIGGPHAVLVVDVVEMCLVA